MTGSGSALTFCVFFVPQGPCPLRIPSGLCPTQCCDPSCTTFCCYSNSCCCHFPVPWLYWSSICPVLSGCCHCCRCRRSCIWAVPICSLTSTDKLHDHSRVWVHCPAATRHCCHPGSCRCCCRLQPVSTSAAPDGSHAVKPWILPCRRKAGEVALYHEKGGVWRGKTEGAEWWLSILGFNSAVLLPKSLKKITKNMETNDKYCCIFYSRVISLFCHYWIYLNI